MGIGGENLKRASHACMHRRGALRGATTMCVRQGCTMLLAHEGREAVGGWRSQVREERGWVMQVECKTLHLS